jgi:MarR family transcriptional regulator, organic hydroperoxide resistance regulator
MSGARDAREEALERLALAWREMAVAERRLRAYDGQRRDELSFAHMRALGALEDGEEMSAGRLAAAADLAPGSVTQMLDALEERGMVRRTRSAADRRVVMVALTEAGRERVAARRAAFRERLRQALTDLDASELAAGERVLERLARLLRGLASTELAGEDGSAEEPPLRVGAQG